jgi:hypothetical protein
MLIPTAFIESIVALGAFRSIQLPANLSVKNG